MESLSADVIRLEELTVLTAEAFLEGGAVTDTRWSPYADEEDAFRPPPVEPTAANEEPNPANGAPLTGERLGSSLAEGEGNCAQAR